MGECTAPKTGRHRTLSGAERCPVHGTGRIAAPRDAEAEDAPVLPSLTAAAVPPAPPRRRVRPARRTAVGGSAASRSDAGSTTGAASVSAAQAGLFAVVAPPAPRPDPADALFELAAALSEEAGARDLAGHALCTILADAADSADADGEASARSAGIPDWVAELLELGLEKTDEADQADEPSDEEQDTATDSQSTPSRQNLRALQAMVCPSAEDCPAQDRPR
ncbi:hypothetical protein ACXET9_15310 [Brachybacterium sp. DNPG3]